MQQAIAPEESLVQSSSQKSADRTSRTTRTSVKKEFHIQGQEMETTAVGSKLTGTSCFSLEAAAQDGGAGPGTEELRA
jgi:hypothetical protein